MNMSQALLHYRRALLTYKPRSEANQLVRKLIASMRDALNREPL